MNTRVTLKRDGIRQLLLGVFALDILFLPFVLPIAVPMSVLVFPSWLLFARKRTPLQDHLLLFVAAGLVLAVYMAGRLAPVNLEGFGEAQFNNTGLMMFMLLSFAAIDDLRHDNLKLIYRLLQAYIIFSLGLSLAFLVDPYSYYALRSFWAFDDSDMSLGPISTITRCTGILSDPNNHAVSICAIAAFLVAVKRTRVLLNLVTIFACAIIVTTTMSATGFICLAILGAYFFYSSRITNSKVTDSMTKVFLFLVCLVIVAFVLRLVQDILIFQLALERLGLSDVNSRFDRWAIIFDLPKIYTSLFFGDGGAIYWDGRLYKPHNGHFHVFFAFGGLVYVVFMANMFNIRKWDMWRDAAFMAIIFAGFTVNVGIYEHRFAGIWLLLLGGFYEFAGVRNASRREKRGQGISAMSARIAP